MVVQEGYTCEFCGNRDIRKNSRRKYCSTKCRKHQWRSKPENREKESLKYKEYHQKNKSKANARCKKYYASHREEICAKHLIYYSQSENKAKVSAYCKREDVKEYKKMKRNRPEEVIKTRARKKANSNIKIPKGKLCEVCVKNNASEKHHEDYSKPLEVKFLCVPCHRKLHGKY